MQNLAVITIPDTFLLHINKKLMPVFELSEKMIFPPPNMADSNGLLAVGGDLSPRRLLLAYGMGLFPWYNEGDPVLWWSPDPRIVLRLNALKVSKSLKRVLKKEVFSVTMDEAFDAVINSCATVKRKGESGTWIVGSMVEAYIRLHDLGFAHSVEVWEGSKLAGGLYGVSLGRVFFGESMFHKRTDASKVALVYLVSALRQWNFHFIDCQVTTGYLKSMGAGDVSRAVFLSMLENSLKFKPVCGRWSMPPGVKHPAV